MDAFSVAATILIPEEARNFNTLVKLASRQTGIESNAPADVFTASALMAAPPFVGITMASTPAHSHVLAIAPKLRTSVTPSKTTINGMRPSS